MKHSYTVTGMTCNNCVASVAKALSKIDEVEQVEVNLEKAEAEIYSQDQINLERLKSVFSNTYSISEKIKNNSENAVHLIAGKTKLQQLKPLLLIFLYLFSAVFLLNYSDWNSSEAMLDFMGLFYIVFSFFKFLDLKGFPESFRMYDPLAKVIPVYGRVYPFIELSLGLMFLLRYTTTVALLVTLLILGSTTLGVLKTLLDKKNIRCACLGTALKLPMTEATLIENTIMLLMALLLLTQQFI